jgi:hypothetical protein
VSSLDLPVSFLTADRSFVSSSAPSFLFGGLLHVALFCSCASVVILVCCLFLVLSFVVRITSVMG